ncbi:hypothetical protein [Rhodopseudomonas palustris]|uniref:hypothetical protein n=1 Tax=Rhodopseudomonas palustris TaxID=1076 RepID=UPI0005A0AE5B
MTSIDGEQSSLVPHCELCSTAMTLIGRLPRISLQPSVQVFRCLSCNHVVSAEHRLSAPSGEATARGG